MWLWGVNGAKDGFEGILYSLRLNLTGFQGSELPGFMFADLGHMFAANDQAAPWWVRFPASDSLLIKQTSPQ